MELVIKRTVPAANVAFWGAKRSQNRAIVVDSDLSQNTNRQHQCLAFLPYNIS